MQNIWKTVLNADDLRTLPLLHIPPHLGQIRMEIRGRKRKEGGIEERGREERRERRRRDRGKGRGRGKGVSGRVRVSECE